MARDQERVTDTEGVPQGGADNHGATAHPLASPEHVKPQPGGSTRPMPLDQDKMIREGVRPEGSAGSQPDVDYRKR